MWEHFWLSNDWGKLTFKPRGKVVHFLLYVGQSCKIIKTASLHMPRLAAFRGTGCNLKGSSQDS